MIAAKAARPDVAGALGLLAGASRAVAAGESLQPTLEAIVEAAALGVGADVAVCWLREGHGDPVARAVWARSASLGAEIEGLRLASGSDRVAAVRDRVDPEASTLSVPLEPGSHDGESLELVRRGEGLEAEAEHVVSLAADLASLATQLCSDQRTEGHVATPLLDIAGDALAAASEGERTAARIARVAALAAGAQAALLWRQTAAGGSVVGGRHGDLEPSPSVEGAAAAALSDRQGASEYTSADGTLVTLQLGQPPVGILQLLYAPGSAPTDLTPLASFAVRAAHALRAADRSSELGVELERSRALLAVVGEAISRLSLSHTLDTALERVAALLGTERVALYLAEDGVLSAAASRSLDGPHEQVARRLLELALGALGSRSLFELDEDAAAEALGPVEAEATAAGIGSFLALPLVVGNEPIGLLAVYPSAPRLLTENESVLLSALAAQLAVVVQNARLHERAKELGSELEASLTSEREAARRLRALYEISRSFAQSLSLETTLDVLAESIVTLLGVDAAVIRMPDERGVDYVVRALHVNDQRVDAAVRALLSRPQPLPRSQIRSFVEEQEPLLLDPATAAELGGSLALLAPFLEKGSTAAMIPIATAGELLATLTIVSLHPGRPVAGEIADTALSITGQAALAIDNARLYAQQKAFADTMQRSLLPDEVPHIPGLEIGDVYESAARVDVGGDVYDYLVLPDGRLAVVLGDVTGHGVEATADMAMAKFVFRSLARVHVDPGQFLAAANEVVASEIATGKFITMFELVIDAEAGTVAGAGAGHPPPRLVFPDGRVEGVDAFGLALGIDVPQVYEPVVVDFPVGASVVLYTDGVVEARREGEQFGIERLDALLAEKRDLPPKQIALAALDACRAYSDGGLTDDFAVVVIKRAE